MVTSVPARRLVSSCVPIAATPCSFRSVLEEIARFIELKRGGLLLNTQRLVLRDLFEQRLGDPELIKPRRALDATDARPCPGERGEECDANRFSIRFKY